MKRFSRSPSRSLAAFHGAARLSRMVTGRKIENLRQFRVTMLEAYRSQVFVGSPAWLAQTVTV